MAKKKSNKISSNQGEEASRSTIGDFLNIQYDKQETQKNFTDKSTSKVKLSPSGRVEIWLNKKGRGNNPVSSIHFDPSIQAKKENFKSILKSMKVKFACGGTVTENGFILQYTQRENIKFELIQKGYQAIICGA